MQFIALPCVVRPDVVLQSILPQHTAPRHVLQPCVVSQFFAEVGRGMSSSDRRRRHTGQQGDATEHEAAAAHEAPAKEAMGCKAAVEAAPQREAAADEAAVQQKAGSSHPETSSLLASLP